MSDPEKKTAAINFRVPASFREKVAALAKSTGWTISDVASIGLLAFWPEIEALVTASGPQPPKDLGELRGFIELCRTAQVRGVDPKKALTDALERKFADDAFRSVDAVA